MHRLLRLFNLMNQVEDTKGLLAKAALLSNYDDRNTLLKFIRPAIDPYFNFKVSEYTLPYCNDIIPIKVIPDIVEHDFEMLINDLRSNKLKPAEAREQCTRIMAEAASIHKDGCKWMRRIFVKNLAIGVHHKVFERIFNIKLKHFEVHLAVDTAGLTKNTEDFETHPEKYIMEPKYDGLRMITLFDENIPFFYTRNGRQLYNLGPIATQIENQSKNLLTYVIDGEVYGKSWNETASVVRASKTTKYNKNLTYYVFDIIPRSDWDKQECFLPLHERKEILKRVLHDTTNIKQVKYYPAISKENVLKFYKQMIKEGLEGAMLKDLTAPYKFGRSKDWLKVKEVHTIDVLCTNVLEGIGMARGKLGAIVVEYNGIESKVGSGFTNAQRDYYWQHKNEIVGHYVEIAYQTITPDGHIRFGRFVRVREDK